MAHPAHHLALHKPSHKRLTKTVDHLAYIVGIGGNIAVIPQILEAWRSDAPGMAIQTWILFVVISFIWLAYAILHKSKVLIIAQITSITANLLVVIGWTINRWFI